MKKCVVIGSINMDMVATVDRFPEPGETRTGIDFKQVPGGKGANQAVALGRLGVDTAMAGCVGDDASGDVYMENFQVNGVDTANVRRIADCATGTAVIEVDATGENHIIIVPGANGKCDLKWLDQAFDGVMDGDIFLLQLEIPHETVFEAVKRLHAAGKIVILDPAPASAIPDDVLACVDIITPNETELATLTREIVADMLGRMEYLRGKGVRTVIAKSGADGAWVLDDAGATHVAGFKVRAADTTAAGDTFNAGLARGVALNWNIRRAMTYANAAAAISVTAPGAQGGMPTPEMVEKFIENNIKQG
jgi:ribokinase